VLRADNRGEGGILALMALVRGKVGERGRWAVVGLGLFGAALLYADGVLTPAISVLGAVEGLAVAAPALGELVVPASVAILVGLFLFQHRGTAGVGAVFGPVMLVWFGTIAVLGVAGIVRQPAVLAAVHPMHGIRFFAENGWAGFLVLGAVFLVATGGEALYADLGHFGELPIQIDWFAIVGPSLLLNYFGQGALLLQDPETAHNPFFRMAPEWMLYPLIGLATAATIIASQAVISGVFSLTRQAVQLGFAPRVDIVHTSSSEIGQIYIPAANFALMVSTLALVVIFGSSGNLAAAYGVAVATTMIITTILAYVVSRRLWHWPRWGAWLVTGGLLVADLAFFGANMAKFTQGGWFPLLIGGGGFLLFTTWRLGRRRIANQLRDSALPIDAFLEDLANTKEVIHVPGTAIYLNSSPDSTPIALLHNLKLNHALHDENFILVVVTEEVPYVPGERRLEVQPLPAGFTRLILRYGFMEDPDVPVALAQAASLSLDLAHLTYILSNNTLVPTRTPGMPFWRKRLFAFLYRNAARPSQFFRLPPNRVVELGMQIKL
jgi:KUP system potassium uptake protein